ncbi:MAG: hypothetical protein ACNS63_02575 [Candidatus Nitrospinota bacterium M3_3B_026]
MSFRNLKTPSENGGTLFLPPLSEYAEALEANRRSARDTLIDGEPLAGLAGQARAEALSQAARYTKSLGLDPGPEPAPEGPVIASGHQPVIFHPGVAIKPMILAREARRLGAAALFVSVDSDEFKGRAAPAPARDNVFRRVEHPLFPPMGGLTFEAAAAEPEEKLRERLRGYRSLLSDPAFAGPAAATDEFLARLEKRGLYGHDHTSRAVVMRRVWMAPVADGFLEIPVSVICEAVPFKKFASDVIERLELFREIYNAELAAYRKEKKLRYPANPFPGLGERDGRLETPFWVRGADGGRERLFARKERGGTLIAGETAPARPLSGLGEGSVHIRPRAIVLSMYLRLFISDLFIHGVGGAKYDTITDRIIERFYGLASPRYAVASATLWPDVPFPDPSESVERTKEALREIERHPEKAAGEDTGEMGRLAGEKVELVRKIAEPGADRKTLGKNINRLNSEMGRLLAPERRRLEEELAGLSSLQAQRRAVLARDYPFFLYRPERVYGLLDG